MYQDALFWLLTLVVILPGRLGLSFLAFIVLSHVDMSGPEFHSAGRIGWENAFKSLALPAWLFIRAWIGVRRDGQWKPSEVVGYLSSRPSAGLWLLLFAYAGLASLWSPFPLAGAKLLAALVSHTLVFLAMLFYGLRWNVSHRAVLATLVAILAVGVVQTYALGNPYGSGPSFMRPRFTTFTGPQSFVEGLVPIGAILLWHIDLGRWGRLLSVILILSGAFLNGSRIGFFGALAGLAMWMSCRLDRQRFQMAAIGLGVIIIFFMTSTVRSRFEASRVGEVKNIISQGVKGIEEVGTFRWRRAIYACFAEGLAAKDTGALVIGSGTASAGELALRCDPVFEPEKFSPNRVTHNEFVRAFYEWGVIGILLVSLLCVCLGWAGFRCYVFACVAEPRKSWRYGPLVSTLPVFILALVFENIIQGAGSPAAVGFIAVLALAAAEFGRPRIRNSGLRFSRTA